LYVFCTLFVLLPFGYLFVCFMLLYKKSAKLFRASYVITTIVTYFLVTFWLPSSLFHVVARKSTKLFRDSYNCDLIGYGQNKI
jgi:hypothetical protein